MVGKIFNFLSLEAVGFALTKSAIGLGAGAPAWFLTSELVSPKVTELCQSISTGSLLIASGLSTFVYLPSTKLLGIYSILFIAVLPAIIVAVILCLFLPETKDKKYDEIRLELLMNFFSGIEKYPRNPGVRNQRVVESAPLRSKKYEKVKYGSLTNEDSTDELRLF